MSHISSISWNEEDLIFRPFNYQYNRFKKNPISFVRICFTDAIPYTGLRYTERESGLHAKITVISVKKCLALYLLLLICIRLFQFSSLFMHCYDHFVNPSKCQFVVILLLLLYFYIKDKDWMLFFFCLTHNFFRYVLFRHIS